MPYIIVGIICGAICGIVAASKGRSVAAWVLLGFLFGIIPLIIVAALPNLKEQKDRDTWQAEENRRLREQLRQERLKGEAFRQHAAARLDAHDKHLGLDTRQSQSQLAGGGAGAPLPPGVDGDEPRWYYGTQGRTVGPMRVSQIVDLIRARTITRETLVWSEDLSDWLPAGEVHLFSEQFGA